MIWIVLTMYVRNGAIMPPIRHEHDAIPNPKFLQRQNVNNVTDRTACIVSFGQGSSLLWAHTMRPFYSRPTALTQEERSPVNDVCECMRD